MRHFICIALGTLIGQWLCAEGLYGFLAGWAVAELGEL